jgi:imidazolonepropionase-like amidohydrolase
MSASIIALLAALSAPAATPEGGGDGKVQAIVGAWVLPASGPPIPRGVVLYMDGKVLDVGPELPVPPGAVVRDAEGKYVCPGFVAIEASRVGVSGAPGKVADGLDPYARDLRIALACGITTAHVVEAGFGGFFMGESRQPSSGSTAIVKASVGSLEGMLVKEPAAIYLSFRRAPLAAFQLREGFRKAAEHIRRTAEAERAKAKPPQIPPEIARLVSVLKDEVPAIVSVDSEDEIRAILAIRREFPFDLVLSGAEEAWKLAPELAAARVPVLTKARGRDFSFDFDEPAVPEGGMIPIRRPGVLAAAGVRVAMLPYRRGISLDGLAGRDLTALPFEAAFAVRGGMDEDAALRAITIEPARILRIADRVGSLERGKDADILILNRHPLDVRSFVETAIVGGKVYYERKESPLFRDIPLR